MTVVYCCLRMLGRYPSSGDQELQLGAHVAPVRFINDCILLLE